LTRRGLWRGGLRRRSGTGLALRGTATTQLLLSGRGLRHHHAVAHVRRRAVNGNRADAGYSRTNLQCLKHGAGKQPSL
jgi:hypothetical protein